MAKPNAQAMKARLAKKETTDTVMKGSAKQMAFFSRLKKQKGKK